MPTGYLTAVVIVALYTVLVLRAPRRPAGLARATFLMTHWVSEYPFIALAALAVSTVLVLAQGDLTSAGGWVLLGVAAATALGLLDVVRRASSAGRVIETALADRFNDAWRAGDGGGAGPRPLSSLRVLRDVLAPFPVRPRGVRRISNVAYGDAGKRNLMDLYRPRDAPAEPGPVLIHFHGGHFQIGRKSREARPLLYRLASEGWLCISANYRLRAAGRFPNSLIDAKSVIAWARAHAFEHGADPSLIVVAGGSAGGHLASMAALTPNDPAFQPAGADVDTTVGAAICLYGYYGPRTSGAPPSSPQDYITREAPPFLVAAGDNDNQIDVSHADQFVERLRSVSAAPVVYFRLPGAQHSFDLFRSLRFDQVVDGIVAFLGWVRTHPGNPSHDPETAQPAALRE
ncbi:MAG: alpha/beta hydrolase [Solirubrobacteraceae bacterium]